MTLPLIYWFDVFREVESMSRCFKMCLRTKAVMQESRKEVFWLPTANSNAVLMKERSGCQSAAVVARESQRQWSGDEMFLS